MLSREEQVAFCEKCTNRKPSLQGLLCKLTDEKAAFEETCPDFELDEQEQTNLDKQRRDAAKGDYVGAEIEVGILNGGIIVGSLAIIGSLVWFFGAWIYMDTIFFYPPVLLVIGIISLVRGIREQNVKKRQKMREALEKDVLDSEI
ncbi:hypothetical protein OAK35_01505 [Crocinitomicaceae bacterium]|nr:hypothetical protein [Crocinitomicaceae bacterium]